MMRRLSPFVLLVLLTAAPAIARESANPRGRVVRDIVTGMTVSDAARRSAQGAPLASSATPASVTVSPVPLPAGAIVLDSTWYDLQDMGSLGARIVIGADGRVYVTYQKDYCELGGGCPPNLGSPQPYPNRAMGYAVRTAGLWDHRGKVQDPDLWGCCLTEKLGGHGSIALAPDGRVAISQHMNEEGCDLRGIFYLQDAVGATTYTGELTPIISPSYLFPQVVATTDGSFTVFGEVPKGGQYDEVNDFRISHLASPGATFGCPVGWQMGAWTAVAPPALFRDGKPAFPSMAAASDGRVGIAVGDFGGNLYLIESSDGTFAPATVRTRPITAYSDAQVTATDSTSTQFRPYIHCHLAYNDTTPNVVWSELQARRSGANVVYFDHRSRILHWDSQRGIEVVKQVAAGEADRYDDLDNGLNGPLSGFNTISVDWPQVGFSADGRETYVAWQRYADTQVDATADAGLPGIVTGIGFGDICISVARTGESWSAAQNLTNTPATDERFFSLAARNSNGRAQLVFQAPATDQAGVTVIGDRGATPGNLLRRIAYLEAPLTASVVGVPPAAVPSIATIRVSPNPTHGAVAFALPRAGGANDWLEVIGVDGRAVARLATGAASALRWDGRDASGHPVAAGIYFARLASDPSVRATRFTLLR
ncbi:MAG: hypothetical protein HOP12_10955 [Candidatus Eisenbacteria bacterium]|uniref:FlgD Ig-like domain-containing protein n=1 Tax=Eiseniibacteriota bacterium TaxID=2212470 RepID=A0A849SH14_UNCEI|nr:hypothetical protein [Candidatus Eisenbacteria bacterium]